VKWLRFAQGKPERLVFGINNELSRVTRRSPNPGERRVRVIGGYRAPTADRVNPVLDGGFPGFRPSRCFARLGNDARCGEACAGRGVLQRYRTLANRAPRDRYRSTDRGRCVACIASRSTWEHSVADHPGASQVEPGRKGQWLAYLAPGRRTVAWGPLTDARRALADEEEWLQTHWLVGSSAPDPPQEDQ